MRWKSGQKDESHRRILEAAGQLFRERGFGRTSVSDVMERAGLTVGGFYAHFDSKDDLLASILASAFEDARATLFRGLGDTTGAGFVREVTRRYLSRSHRDAIGDGCPLPSLAAEVGRQGDAPRAEIERYLREIVDFLEEKAPTSRTDLSRRELALAITAMSVGGLLLARVVRDESLSDAILEACRKLASASVDG